MSSLVCENLTKAQKKQKDQNARNREVQEGEWVLVLLPTSNNKLLACWQRPYGRVGPVD